MRILLSLLLLSIVFAPLVPAQSPFQFREAALLGTRMWRSGADYSAVNSQTAGRLGPSLANQIIPDANDLNVYRSERWVGLLSETDFYRRNGALTLAERQYLDLLSKLRQVQGEDSIDVGWMLDHLGEFYLETRDFDKAYQEFSEALRVRRTNIQLFDHDQQTRIICLAHSVKLLVLLGRLDLAKDNLAQADQELLEAINIDNQIGPLREGLDAIYFRSLLLEKLGKSQEAESLWRSAANAREKIALSDSYWDLMKEMAAFYARRCDYHTAATIVSRIQSETDGKRLSADVSVLDTLAFRQGIMDDGNVWRQWYKAESEVAMAAILALDRWVTSGPLAAAPLFAAPLLNRPPSVETYYSGSDSQRARLLAFFTQRAYLHLSILLDGSPSPEGIRRAYEAIQHVKGSYLDFIAKVNRLAEFDRNNPHVSYAAYNDPTIMLDNLAKERVRHAHFFVAAALDGKPFSNMEFAASEQAEQAVSEGLAYAKRNQLGWYQVVDFEDPQGFVPPGSAFVDIVAWERTERTAPHVTHREYGAFIMRKDKAIRFIRLGPAADIDADISSLESIVVGHRLRGFSVNQQSPPVGVQETNRILGACSGK